MGEVHRLTVVVPVYNEAPTVRSVIDRAISTSLVDELIAVDDGSTDGTAGELEAAALAHDRVRVMRHDRNRGKGAALRTGFSAARGTVILIQDADFEYDPAEYPSLLAPILAGEADVVLGTRFLEMGSRRLPYFWHGIGNRILSWLTRAVTGLHVSDMECGSKVFRAAVIKRLRLMESGFGIEPELVCKVARLSPRLKEVPVSYRGRTFAQGRKIHWTDGVDALRCLVLYGLMGR